MSGTIGILNVGAGDTKITFDKANPKDCAKAGKIVQEMLQAGYAILVQVGTSDDEPIYQRAKAFDVSQGEYIIPNFDPITGKQHDDQAAAAAPAGTSAKAAKPRRGRKAKNLRLKATETRAVAVARSAGG